MRYFTALNTINQSIMVTALVSILENMAKGSC